MSDKTDIVDRLMTAPIRNIIETAREAATEIKTLRRHATNLYQDACEGAYAEVSFCDAMRQALSEVAPEHPALKGQPPNFGTWESLVRDNTTLRTQVADLTAQRDALREAKDKAKQYGFNEAMQHLVACQELRGLDFKEVEHEGQTFRYFVPPEGSVHFADGTVRTGTWYECPQNASGARSVDVPPGHTCVVVQTALDLCQRPPACKNGDAQV